MAWLLDTNVVSEIRKGLRADPSVLAWYAAADAAELYTSVLVIGEIRQGVERLALRDPLSAKKLERWVQGLETRFAERILSVSLEVADCWGRLCPAQPLAPIDGLLAATALHHGLIVATRNVADVARSGVETFNPFG